MLINNLPIIQLLLLLFSGVCCSLLGNKYKIAWIVAILVTTLSTVISFVLLSKVNSSGIITYSVGHWPAPYGIELKIDLLNSIVLSLINFIAVISLIYGYYVNIDEIKLSKLTSFYSLFLLALSGFVGMLITNDIFNVYVFLEIASIASCVLVAMAKSKQSLISSFSYLLNSTVGATFYLIGIGFLYSKTGTLNISDLFIHLQSLHDSRVVQAAALLIIIGLFIKMALFPVHYWLIEVYNEAPTFVTVFFAGTTAKVMIYLLIRYIYNVFGTEFLFTEMKLNLIFMVFAGFGIICAPILAIFFTDIRKIFAYSSVSQISYIILALSLNRKFGITAAIIHMINHSIVKSGIFMILGAMSRNFKSKSLYAFQGIGRVDPYSCSAFLIFSLSLIGIPITAGFVSKWYILEMLASSQTWIMLFVFLLGSVLSVVYVLKVIEVIYFKPCVNIENRAQVPIFISICIWLMAAFTIVFGTYFKPIVMLAHKIALMYGLK